MNFDTVKRASEISLHGVSVEFESIDGGVRSVVIRDSNGGFVKVTRGESYNETLRVLIPARPKEAKVHVISGKLLGIADFREEFEQRYEADARLSAIKTETGIYDADNLGLDVSEETVLREADAA